MFDRFLQTISRRRMLQVGGLGSLGATLPALLRADEQTQKSGLKPLADACIILYLNGGPSHLDMWDMKPTAAAEIRGEFRPIPTSLPGYQMSELLPRMAQQAHLATVVRSMHHSVNNAHAAAVYVALTGHDRGELGGGAKPSDNPAPGSVLSMLRPPQQTIVPFVHLPYITKEGAGGPPQPGFFGGYLGRSWDPLFVVRDPNAPGFAVPELTLGQDVSSRRLADRESLFQSLNAEKTAESSAGQMTKFQQRAIDLLTSPATQRAFNLGDETDALRDRYGRNIYGQSTLLARRLIEAGTRVVTLSWAPDANATWDTHGGNFRLLKNTLLPQLDAACSSLIDDLQSRGMLDRTLVAVMGDFGRTPKVNANAGRDHWNFCYSLMLTGGGFQKGLIYGTSDKIGAFPDSNPLTPADILCTIYHALGIRHDREMLDQLGRPHRLVPTGELVRELLV